jgi:hypothetical protein
MPYGGYLGERRHCVESVSSESYSKLLVKRRKRACFCEPAQSLRNCSGSLWLVPSFRPELALSEFVTVIEVLPWVQAHLCWGTDIETGLGTA